MSTLIELTHLHLTRPAANAPAGVVTAWQHEHARVLEHLAAEGSPLAARAATALRTATGSPLSTVPSTKSVESR